MNATDLFPASGAQLVEFATLAGLMVGANLFLLTRLFPRRVGPPTFSGTILVLGFLLMAVGFWFAVIYAIVSPGDASTVSVFIAGNSMMAVVGAWLIGLFYGAEDRRLPAHGWRWPVGIATLFIGNEILMGVAYALAQYGPATYSSLGWLGLAELLSTALDSAWFLWAMAASMVFLLAWLPLERPVRWSLLGLAASAVVSAWVIPAPWVGALGVSAAMGGTLAVLVVELRTRRTPRGPLLRLGVGVAVAFAGMSIGALLVVLRPGAIASSATFGLINLAIMFGEFAFLAAWGFASGSWHEAPVPRSEPSPSIPVPRSEM